MRGRLRRLLGRRRGEAGAEQPARMTPAAEPDAPERIDAARKRLKATIPPPDDEPPAGSAPEPPR